METSKNKIVKLIPWLECAIGLILLVYAVYMLVTQLTDYSKSSDLYENTNDEYVSVAISDTTKEDIKEETTTDWKDLADVDITKLREVNEDIAGWIYFENTEISYPVLYSADNDKYLRRTYTGESLTAGSIFIEGSNNRDFSDAHTIIYGHNMNDYSMFGKLEYFITEKDYVADHDYFQIITEQKKYRYRIISYKIVGDDNDIYTVYQSGSEQFVNFVKEDIQGGSFKSIDFDITSDDHVITLSTCFKDDRLVVSAVRCDECIIDK